MAVITAEIELGCQCGKLTGVMRTEPKGSVNHICCYCIDCQTFSNHLGANDITLNEHRGTAIIQTSPATLAITTGSEHLQCLRLSPKGITRWYSGCCNTPIANTMSNGKIPFAGVIRAFVKTENVEQIAGPIKYKVFASLAPEANGHNKAPLGLIFKIFSDMFTRKIRGHQKHSPFFNADTHQPVCKPKTLTLEERKAATPII